MPAKSKPKNCIRALRGISHEFAEPRLLALALTHRSFDSHENYERLEFLGDSVLNFVIASQLFASHPTDNEGNLSRLRSRVVRRETLARIGRQLELGKQLQFGAGELRSGGHQRDSTLADALEAVLGAIYLDGGIVAAEKVIAELFGEVLAGLPDAELLKDAKTRLQEWLQARGRPLPEYTLVSEQGADHRKVFEVRCSLPDADIARAASGGSRRQAEQAAAGLVLGDLVQANR